MAIHAGNHRGLGKPNDF